MAVTILGYHINIIRRKRIYQPIKCKQLWRDQKPSKPMTIRLTRQKMRRIAQQMGYTLQEV